MGGEDSGSTANVPLDKNDNETANKVAESKNEVEIDKKEDTKIKDKEIIGREDSEEKIDETENIENQLITENKENNNDELVEQNGNAFNADNIKNDNPIENTDEQNLDISDNFTPEDEVLLDCDDGLCPATEEGYGKITIKEVYNYR